jgi:hypothetical protein
MEGRTMITRDRAIAMGGTGKTLYHYSARNADKTATRVRVNGKCKVWKRDPTRFSLPVKWGLKRCFYIDQHNAHEWFEFDPTELNLPGAPANVLHDAAIDAGLIAH